MTTAPTQPHALGRLIREVQQANGWSYADISANARQAGRSLSRSRVESLRNDPLTSIGIKAIEALAAGLSVAPDRVAAVAVESMGYRPQPADSALSAAEALGNDPLLSAQMRRVLTAALAAAHAEFHASAGSAPSTDHSRQTSLTGDSTLEDIAADDP